MRLRSLLTQLLIAIIPAAALATGIGYSAPWDSDGQIGSVELRDDPPDPTQHHRPELEVPEGPPDPLPSIEAHSRRTDDSDDLDFDDHNGLSTGDHDHEFTDHDSGEVSESDREHESPEGVVPEPSTALLFVGGLAGFAARRRGRA